MANKYTCEYCGTCQTLTTVWSCVKCGAPIAPKEKPTFIQRVLGSAMITDNAQGIDISKWQGDMNFSVTKQVADFVIPKASENIWEDSKYAQNVTGLQQHGIYYGVYHFCRPEYGWKAQAEYFASRVVGHLPAWADIERTGGLSPDALQKWLYNFVSLVEDMSGYPVGIYCRGSWWNTYVGRNNWAGNHPLWIARYSDYLSGPWSDGRYKPYEWDTWTLWQWSADGNGEGSLYGAQSNSIDKNWFNGTYDMFLNWIDEGVSASASPSEEPYDECAKFVVTADALNVRSGPGTNYSVVAQLNKGDIVNVEDLGGSNVWVEIAPGKWCAHTYNYVKYMEKI